MADFPLFGGIKSKTLGVSEVTSRGTTLTSGGTVNTKGAYVELVSAANNTHNSSELSVIIEKVEGALCQTYVDIAIGEAGFEKVIISDLFYYGDAGINTGLDNFTFPLGIPSGVRISARSQADAISQPVIVGVRLNRGNFKARPPLQTVETHGTQPGTKGTTVTQGVNTWGAYQEIVPSTTHDWSGFVVSCHRAATSWSSGGLVYKVAIGAAGFEVDVTGAFQCVTNGGELGGGFVSPFNDICIPSGTRVSVSDSAAAGTDYAFDFVLYGVR